MRQNPLYYYGYAFTVCLSLYMLKFSMIVPPLPWELFLFLVLSICFAFLIGCIVSSVASSAKSDKASSISLKKLKLFIGYILIIADFLLDSSTWPMITFILNFGKSFSHVGSGTKTLHVLAVTYSSYLAITLFLSLLRNKRIFKDMLHFFVFFVLYPVMLFNRGYIVFLSVAFFYVFWSFKKVKSAKKYKVLLVVLICAFAFGVLGNLRMSGKAFNSEPILTIGGASEAFTQSHIPKPFFWGYIYLTSPLANLSLNVAQPDNNLPLEYCISTFLPDFIKKRLKVESTVSPNLVTDAFNVATIFTVPYLYFGWVGMFGAYVFIVVFTSFFYYISNFLSLHDRVILRAILASICFHTFFVNSIVFSGFSFQIVYPILFSFLEVALKRNKTYKIAL